MNGQTLHEQFEESIHRQNLIGNIKQLRDELNYPPQGYEYYDRLTTGGLEDRQMELVATYNTQK